jgi:DNA-binding MarR family transcriptional regulator
MSFNNLEQQNFPMATEPLSKTRLRLWLKILKTSRSIEAEVREKLRAEFGSTLPRFDVLAALHRSEEGLKMGDLSAELKVSNGNVTGIVERLVKDGMVLRVPVPEDRRALLVRLTQKGKEYFLVQAEAHEGWIDQHLSAFDEQEANQLQSLLSLADNQVHDDERINV